jgi:chromate transporter
LDGIETEPGARREKALDVLGAFAKLGVTCFGGPAAHLGYFHAEFVVRRRWLNERAFADLVALCQFLPGPASSQTGVAIGLMRGGYLGGLAAWAGFTLPSATLLILFAHGAGSIARLPAGAGLLHGLTLVAVAIVAQAVWGMGRSLCPDRPRASIATAACILVLVAPGSLGQIGAIALGGLAGLTLCRTAPGPSPATLAEPLRVPISRAAAVGCLGLFAALLVVPLLIRTPWPGFAVFNAFYRAGALVFGGGHVVLPLLRDAVVTPGWVSKDAFLAGYGAAQAVPGPLFTFAAYLGAVLHGPSGGLAGAAIALVAIFLPGMLLLMGALPFWDALRSRPRAQAAMRGVNAAVVGLLGAALYAPAWTSAVHSPADLALALLGFVLLVIWRAPPLLVVAIGALGGSLRGAFG